MTTGLGVILGRVDLIVDIHEVIGVFEVGEIGEIFVGE